MRGKDIRATVYTYASTIRDMQKYMCNPPVVCRYATLSTPLVPLLGQPRRLTANEFFGENLSSKLISTKGAFIRPAARLGR